MPSPDPLRNPAFVAKCLLAAVAALRLHDGWVEGPFCYLLMEFVDGVNLRQAMRAGRFSPLQALGVVQRICEALQYAHGEGVLHRDIKPENRELPSNTMNGKASA